jgi:cysteine desulfurase family protein (TIGR01976 family)
VSAPTDMHAAAETLPADAPLVDVHAIRAHFPALARRHDGHPVAYFDGPGGTQVPRVVAESMVDYLYHHNANTHWAYPSSAETDALLLASRQTLADFLNAGVDEIAFGANMTTLAFHLARGIGRSMKEGDEIVVTELDHHANVAPWRALERERGVVVRTVRLDTHTGRHDWDDFERLVGPRTRLVAVGAASNALGTITDVARAIAMARAVGAQSFVDAVHFAPHELVDVRRLGCDWLACSAYKFYGPHVGVLYGRAELMAEVAVPKLAPSPNTAPERLETGTGNHEGIVGAAAAVEFLASWGGDEGMPRRARLERAYAALHRQGERLVRRLWDGLAAIGGVTLYGPPPGTPRTPTVSFTVRGLGSEEVTRRLVRRGVFVSHGDFYAATVAERLGLADAGLVRAGAACYTTDEEVDRLVDGVREMAR